MRTRSSGWKHAKLSGHKNEDLVESLFHNDAFKTGFEQRLGIDEIVSSSVGGLIETDVPSIFEGKTKSKTDLSLLLRNGEKINISIKKSPSGQVYLISVDRFIEGFEKQFNTIISNDIKELLHIYFYGSPLTESLLEDISVIKGQSQSLVSYQQKHNRLVWSSICNWNIDKADLLLQWFKDNISNICKYCFSRGLAKHENDWAQYVWYINLLGEYDFNSIYSINELTNAVSLNIDEIFPSSINGGSTIQLPFGFVQWHQKQMQFHHNLSKLSKILNCE